MPRTRKQVGQRIARLRGRRSHDEIAAELRTTRQVVIGWEKGHHAPGAESRRKLARVLGGIPDDYRVTDGSRELEDRVVSELRRHLESLSVLAAVQARFLRKLVDALEAAEIDVPEFPTQLLDQAAQNGDGH